ncbi:hypothetical protein GCM10022403_083330 [Streptomyces coacervatus]|uniref:Uncharacterized protein n=1 Tax=Streptomyces coacervatus TaxID=647381 RepID=A0ABP7J9I8_9ACTN
MLSKFVAELVEDDVPLMSSAGLPLVDDEVGVISADPETEGPGKRYVVGHQPDWLALLLGESPTQFLYVQGWPDLQIVE